MKADWFRNEARPRAPGTRAVRGEWSMDTAGTYTCIDHSFAMQLPDEFREVAEDPIQPERRAAELATDKVLLNLEYNVANELFDATTNFSSYTAAVTALSGGAQVAWDTYETSDPVQDCKAMRDQIVGQIGRLPNTLIVGYQVHSVLQIHPVLKEQVKYVASTGPLANAEIARLLGVDNYYVGTSLYTASEEGTTASYSYIWGKYALMAYVTPSPALFSPSLGYVIQYKDRSVNRWREDQERQDIFECSMNYDIVITSAQSGYLVSAVVS